MSYILSREAEDDLIEIYDYSFDAWGERQADLYLQGIYDAFAAAALKPLAGRGRSEFGNGIRSRLFESQVVFYMQWSDGIAIIRVFHQSRDIGDDIADALQSFPRGPLALKLLLWNCGRFQSAPPANPLPFPDRCDMGRKA